MTDKKSDCASCEHESPYGFVCTRGPGCVHADRFKLPAAPTPTPALDLDGSKADAFEELSLTAIMLETWAPECFPEVNEKGQKHFARVMMESAADAINAALASFRTQLAEANARADKADAERGEWKNQAEICRDRLQHTEETLGVQYAELEAVKAERNEARHHATVAEFNLKSERAETGRVTATLATYRAFIEKAVEVLKRIVNMENHVARSHIREFAAEILADLTAAIRKGERT